MAMQDYSQTCRKDSAAARWSRKVAVRKYRENR